MTYNLTKSDGTHLVSLPDNVIDVSTVNPIALIGANSVNFGLYLNENFVYLMQNFAKNTAPPAPLIGQLWYDTASAAIKYYNGTIWKVITPPFDGSAGTATASIAGQAVAFTLAGSQIVYAVSLVAIDPAMLPTSVTIDDTQFSVAARFPYGIAAGVTMASDGNNLRFVGVASAANALVSNMTLSVSGSGNGAVSFNGSGNVTLPLSLTNVTVSGTYTKVTIGSNGIVTSGNLINSSDVATALGYTPGPANGPANSLTFGSNIIINGVVGGSNVFYGNSNITITTTFLDNPMPTFGIISIPVSATIPVGWYICNGQTVTLPSGGGSVVVPNLTSSNLSGCYWIQKVY